MGPKPKAKGQKMGLGDFLTDTSLGSWADEMEDMPLPPSNRTTSYGGVGGGFGSSGDRGAPGGRFESSYQREQLPLPNKPPYTVHLGNLSFDATEGDIHDLFAQCEVTSVRVVEDKLERKPKGFAYVEFASLEGLKKALDFSGQPFQGRNVRVSVAEPQKDRGEARVLDDWSRKGPLQPLERPADGGRRPSDRGFGGGFQRGLDAGPDRERGERRAPFDPNDRTSSARDLTWERRGPLEAVAPAPAPARPAGDRSDGPPRERRNSPAWGEGRGEQRGSQDGSRPPRREFQERPAPPREPTAAEKDTQWRTKMRPDPVDQPPASPKPESTPTSPRAAAPAPALATRPKLNLQKRTVAADEPSPALPSADSSKANPFGAARPVDTLAREQEVEEKMRIKREQEAKERDERRAVEQKAKEEARANRDKEKGEKFAKARERTNGQGKDGEGDENKSKPAQYEILRRAGGDEDEGTETGGEDADANGHIAGDQHVKPQEVVVDPSTGKADGQTTTEALEEEGWSTVGGGGKASKSRRGGARPVAS